MSPLSCVAPGCEAKFQNISQFTTHIEKQHAIDVTNHSTGAVFSHTFTISSKLESGKHKYQSVFVLNKNSAILVDMHTRVWNTSQPNPVLIIQCWYIHRGSQACGGRFSVMDRKTKKQMYTYHCPQLRDFSVLDPNNVKPQGVDLDTALLIPIHKESPLRNTLSQQGEEGSHQVALELQFQFSNTKR
jgi:hypothetical protein